MIGRNQSQPDVFISHVEEDADIALQVARTLEAASYSSWYYERDSVPGVSYLVQTGDAIERSRAVVLIVSVHSLGSNQVSSEVVRAHEAGKPFIPVLCDVTHAQFQSRQPLWRQAVGSAASVSLPSEGVEAIAPRIIAGLEGLGISPTASRQEMNRARGEQTSTPGQAHADNLAMRQRTQPGKELGAKGSRSERGKWPWLAMAAIAIQGLVIVWLALRLNTIARRPVDDKTSLAATVATVRPTPVPLPSSTSTRSPQPTRIASPSPTAVAVATQIARETPVGEPTSVSTALAGGAAGIGVPGAVVAEFFSPGPRPAGIAVVGDVIWLVDDQQRLLYQLDRSANPQASFPLTPTGTIRGLAWDGSSLRLALKVQQKDQAVRLDLTGKVIDGLPLPLEPWGIGWDSKSETLWIAAQSSESFLLQLGADGKLSQTVGVAVHGGPKGLACAPDGFYIVSIFGKWYRFGFGGEALQSNSLEVNDTFPSDMGLSWDEKGYLWVAVADQRKLYQLALHDEVSRVTATPVAEQGKPRPLPRPSLQALEGEDKAMVSVTNALSGRLTISVDNAYGTEGHESGMIEPGQSWTVRLAPGVYKIFASTNAPKPIAFLSNELLVRGYKHTWTLTMPD